MSQSGERLYDIVQPLLAWYSQNARDLPWRHAPTAYQVWISEIMLQQTRVEAVKPYYFRFLSALPDACSLAAVPDQVLLKLWEGLGYYSRARNLKRAAQALVAEYGGQLPRDYHALLQLPGIGEYTAGAIASIAYHIPVPAVDGNVLRVLARYRNDTRDIALPATKRAVREDLAEITPIKRPGDFNRALMELGALVCLPNGQPKCLVCPLADLCKAHQEGTVPQLPVKSKKAARRIEALTVFALWQDGQIALKQRPQKGLLAGLWELPNLPGHLDMTQAMAQIAQWGAQPVGEISQHSARHVFTHVEWDMRVYSLPVTLPRLPLGWEWGVPDHGPQALPTAFRVCLEGQLSNLGMREPL